ncbi:LysR family transcriptional regulator [Piscinibacter terrae]|uniref:LysR family transcriptional regulator n=1 Tax=Piscinibacter terrae TaxID=2496871 RepID=A0A3N7HJR6_9BURK|nr:LysR family transcriptional regulator [Albitalea terrae]RQP22308.1 LysR family transcriptional regulator [Albitalea terrae]
MDTLGDLNDLRFISAIARSGTLAGAARQLRVNHATAFRRLEAMESRLGVRLFERGGGRYTPTPEGEALAKAGSLVEETAAEALRKVAGKDLRPSGLVRITTTDTIAQTVLPGLLMPLRSQCPDISLQVIATNELQSLSKRDADIAIRPSSQPPEHLLGRRIGTIGYGVYGQANALGAWRGQRSDWPAWSTAPWIAVDDSLGQHRSLRWLSKHVNVADLSMRCSSFMSIAHACAGGLGLAVLPCMVGDALPSLRRVGPRLAELDTEAWLLTHADLRDMARIRVVMDALQRGFQQKAVVLLGS